MDWRINMFPSKLLWNFTLIAAAIAANLIYPPTIPAAEVTMKEIQSAWDNRKDHYSSGTIIAEWEKTLEAGASFPRRDEEGNSLPHPPERLNLKKTISLFWNKSSVRREEQGDSLESFLPEPITNIHLATVHKGVLNTHLQKWKEIPGGTGLIAPIEERQPVWIAGITNHPYWLATGRTDFISGQKEFLKDFSVDPEGVVFKDRDLVRIITWDPKSFKHEDTAATREIWLDPDLGFAPVRYITIMGKGRDDFLIDYDQGDRPAPIGWEYSRIGGRGDLRESGKIRITEISNLCDKTEDDFSIEFPEYCLLTKHDNNSVYNYATLPGGKLRPISESEMLRIDDFEELIKSPPCMAGLMDPDSRGQRLMRIIRPALLAVLILVGMWLIIRKKRSI
jgi:hypothetical protein